MGCVSCSVLVSFLAADGPSSNARADVALISTLQSKTTSQVLSRWDGIPKTMDSCVAALVHEVRLAAQNRACAR